MANIKNVVNVTLLEGGRLAARDNVNVVMAITSSSDVLNSSERYRVYKDVGSVNSDFGTSSQVGKAAQTFFATKPNTVSFGGLFVVGYWRSVDEVTLATSATLKSAELSSAVAVAEMQKVSDGSFVIAVDGVDQTIIGLDFRGVTTVADIAEVIDTALTGATCAVDDLGLVITSATTGATSLLGYVEAHTVGSFIGYTLNLAAGTGAELTQGVASGSIVAESKLDAVATLKGLTNAYGMTFLDTPTSAEAIALATWSKANDTMMYDVFSSATNLLLDVTSNPVWEITLSGADSYRMAYSKKANRMLAVSIMARVHTVNFRAENSANTLNLKELSVSPEDYTQTEIEACKKVGLDVYTTIKNTPVVLAATGNGFADYRYNLIAFQDAMQTDLFNLLKSTSTKLAQTTEDVLKLVGQCEKTSRGFVRANVIGAGTWTSPDTFGDEDTFNRGISQNGFYFLAGSLADQDQADRELRNAPVIQGAIKLSGAIHHADIIINVQK